MSRKKRKRSLVKACLLAGWKKVKRDEWPSFSIRELEERLELGKIMHKQINIEPSLMTYDSLWR